MTTDIHLARQVAKHVQLASITLKSAHIESFLIPNEPLAQSINASQKHRCTFDEKTMEDRREIHVTAEFVFSAAKDGGAEDELVKFEASFLLVYTLPSEISFEPQSVRHFAEINGVYNAWPYWREIVHSATGRVGLSGIVIPVYRPTAAQVSEEEPAETAS